ncbi:MAG TPA: hydrogenase maturation protease, partial [Gemmatimonadales bacterium]|nr:hydrogenase maturation protease [Gemmatimonadales bacterium]
MRGLVIGIGHDEQADDAAGPLIARLVAARLPAGWRAVEHHGDLAQLVDLCDGMDEVILADALVSGAPPGTLHHVRLDGSCRPRLAAAGSTHGIGLVEAIDQGRAVGRITGRVTLVGIEAQRTEPGAPMSMMVQINLPLAAAL